MDTSVSDAPVGRLLDGRYRVDARLARGGMATVYEALDTRLDRTIALKVMHPDLAEDQGFVDRFISEARASARLSHPDVVAVYDQGEDDGWVYLAMEYVRGRTLRTVLRERHRLDPELALEVVEHVLAALAAAHDAGIVHRDVKPENVLVATDGRVKVADFGLARAVTSDSSTATRGVLLGTVAYISPEQALGKPATRRSDVYSTGVMLAELLTGHAPHEGATDYLVVRKHIEEDVPAPSTEAPEVPRVVDELVLRATAREPEHRYADAGEFLDAVRHARDVLSGLVPDDEQLTTRYAAVAPVPVAHDTQAVEPAAPPRPKGTGPLDLRADDDESPHRRGRGLLAFMLSLALLVGVSAAAYWYGVARYEVAPSLIDLTAAQADEEAEAAGLDTEVVGSEFSESVAKGLVISTDPEPGARVLDGASIGLVVSKGPERFTVPKVVGGTEAAAEKALAKANLVVGKVENRYDEGVEKGRVISQGTKPGTKVKRGAAVALVVSRGPKPIDVPDVVGADAGEAQQQLEALGLTVRSTEEFSDDVPEGRVVSQDPRDGRLFRGDEVSLVVSKGPETVEVPDVEGRKVDAARKALEDLGLEVKVVTFLPGGPREVLRQSPGGGREVPVGSAVTLYVF